MWSLLLLGAAALSVSVAGIPHDVRGTAALLALGAALVAVFVYVDRRLPAAVLPPSTFGSGPLKWIYLTLGVLMAATMVDMYVPLFGQRLAHLTPVAAGFLGAGLAIGWTVGEISSASLRSSRVISWTVAVAPLVMATGLTMAALTQFEHASVWSGRDVGGGAADHRNWCGYRVAASVGMGDELRRRSRRGACGGCGHQYRPADLRRVRRGTGGRRGQHDRFGRRDTGALGVRDSSPCWPRRVPSRRSEHGQQATQDRSRGLGGLIDERGEVEECVAACEIGQRADD